MEQKIFLIIGIAAFIIVMERKGKIAWSISGLFMCGGFILGTMLTNTVLLSWSHSWTEIVWLKIGISAIITAIFVGILEAVVHLGILFFIIASYSRYLAKNDRRNYGNEEEEARREDYDEN